MKNFLNKKNIKAFTLIEVVVAVGLFSIVMMVALAIILSVVDNNKKVHSVNVVVDNLNFAIDSMVRDIKTGKYYRCDNSFLISTDPVSVDCSNPSNKGVITLLSKIYDNDSSKIVQYEYVPGDLQMHTTGKIVKRSCLSTDSAGYKGCQAVAGSSDLTSSEINITDVVFSVNLGLSGSGTHTQPSVFLLIKGTSAINPTDASNFTIQTLISQRDLNI